MRTHDNATLREACTGALWETNEGQIDLPGHVLHAAHPASNKHIMISYQWDVQKRMVALKDALIKAGYRVWMDVDKMGEPPGHASQAVREHPLLCSFWNHRVYP